jgi:hypothetical protein
VDYRVTALQGGQCRVLGAKDGVQLSLSPQEADKEVAQLVGPKSPMTVQGKNLGRTFVIAEYSGQRAEAVLDVVDHSIDPKVIGGGSAIIGGGGATKPGRLHIYNPGSPGYGPGGPGRRSGVTIPPAALSAGLRFIPDKLQMAKFSLPAGDIRVVEVLADGHDGRDVTADPNLQFRQAGTVVRIEKTSDGVLFRPLREGQSRVTAQLGSLVTGVPLLVVVGDVAGDFARLVVSPEPLTIWAGETASFDSVRLDPGGGNIQFNMNYRLALLPGQTIVESAGEKKLRGLVPGTARVIVTAVDPMNRYNEVSTTSVVRVVASDQLSIKPSQIHLEVGQEMPRVVVTVRGSDGLARQVSATLESLDANVLAPDPQSPGRFVAKSFGATQIRAVYRGKEAVAKVDVSGKRFVRVTTELYPENQYFEVGVKVLAAGSEGPLEYRVYVAGQPPAEKWTPAETAGGALQVELRSPRMAYGAHGDRYELILEARSPKGGSIQRYPLTFQLSAILKRLEDGGNK